MINRNVDWNLLKITSINKKLNLQYLEFDNFYEILLIDGVFNLSCIIDKTSPNSELIDFENNFKLNSNKPLITRDQNGNQLITSSPFTDALGFRFRGESFMGEVLPNSISNIDFKINQERYINGGRLIVTNSGIDDKMTFQVVDKDNILGMGANLVLDQFITNYFIPLSDNLEVRLDYPAKIMQGLYLRLIYTNTNPIETCKVKCNLYLHWKST